MPNGGLTPDCVHCKHYQGKPLGEGEPYCNYHKINLAYPIRAFCAKFAGAEADGMDWLDKELDRSLLHEDMMYLWLGGYEVKFFHVPLVSISEYAQWTSDRFFDELQKLADKYRDRLDSPKQERRMPAELQKLIVNSQRAVLADPDHHLSPDTRRAIYAALEPAAKPPTVQQRRGRLAVLAARRVLPLWELCIPIDEGLAEDDEYNIDRLPHELLTRAERALNSGTDSEQSWTYANDQWYIVGNIGEEFYEAREYADETEEARFHNAYFALTAALHALMETLGHEFLISKTWSIGADNQVHKPLWIDGSIPDSEIDAAGAAMRAEAGADQPDPEKRLRFWNWWLTQAVPDSLRR